MITKAQRQKRAYRDVALQWLNCSDCKWWQTIRQGQEKTCETLHKENCEKYGYTDTDLQQAGRYCPVFEIAEGGAQ